jgi:hypothetical protein
MVIHVAAGKGFYTIGSLSQCLYLSGDFAC